MMDKLVSMLENIWWWCLSGGHTIYNIRSRDYNSDLSIHGWRYVTVMLVLMAAWIVFASYKDDWDFGAPAIQMGIIFWPMVSVAVTIGIAASVICGPPIALLVYLGKGARRLREWQYERAEESERKVARQKKDVEEPANDRYLAEGISEVNRILTDDPWSRLKGQSK